MGLAYRFRGVCFLVFIAQNLYGAKADWVANTIDLGIQNEGQAWTFPLASQVKNPTKSPVKFSAYGLPEWMALDAASGTLTGTPRRQDVGNYDGIVFALYSGGDQLTTRGHGQVLKTLTPPRWTQTEIRLPDARENYPYLQDLAPYLSNPEKTALRFEIVSNTPPTWMGISSKTGSLYGTPSKPSVGEATVRVKLIATLDGNTYQDTTLVRIKIVAVNRAPNWSADPLNLPNALSGRAYAQSLAASASDPDGDALRFSLVSGPAWARLSDNGAFQGMPNNAAAGLNEWVVQVSDGQTTVHSRVRLKVSGNNEAPVWQAATIPLADARDGEPYQVDLSRFASDADGDTLQFLLLSGPDWLQVGLGGALVGVPTRKDVGAVKLAVRADDGKGGTAKAEFSFFVQPINHGPVWLLNPIVTKASEGEAFQLALTPYVQDADGDALAFGTVQTAGWGKLSAQGVFSGTPDFKTVGRNVFTFRATDSQGAGSNVAVWVEVEAINHKPVWSAPRLPAATEGTPYQTTLAPFASDPDAGDRLTFEKLGQKPDWLAVAADGSVSGTPATSDVGAQTARVRVTDSHGDFVETPFVVQVLGTNHAPRWRQNGPLFLGEAFEGSEFRFNLGGYASDADADALVFQAVKVPGWMVVDSNGAISGKPGRADVGPFQAILRVRDAGFWVDTAASGTVRARNQPPAVKFEWPVYQVKERETLQGNLGDPAFIQDADGDKLTFLLKQVVPWIHLEADGKFTLSPASAQRGSQAFAFSVDDGKDSILGALRIEVLPNPRPPVWFLNPIQRLAQTNEPFSISVAPHAQDPDSSPLSFFKKAGPAWLAVNPDGSLEGLPTDRDLGIQTFSLTACNADRQCADAVLTVDVQKGLAGDRVRLGDKTPGASVDVVWLLDPSSGSAKVVTEVQKAMTEWKNALAREAVALTCSTLSTSNGEAPPDGIQSPLWTAYNFFTAAAKDLTAGSRLTSGGFTEWMVVTRQRDGFGWFTDRRPTHRGVAAELYWQSLTKTFAGRKRSLRVSAIAPSCPSLTEVAGSGALPEATYRQWVGATGGMHFDDGCKLHVATWLRDWSKQVSLDAQIAAKKRLALTRQPTSQASLEVSVGGTLLKKESGAWSYDAASNSVGIDWSRVDTRALKAQDFLQVKYSAAE